MPEKSRLGSRILVTLVSKDYAKIGAYIGELGKSVVIPGADIVCHSSSQETQCSLSYRSQIAMTLRFGFDLRRNSGSHMTVGKHFSSVCLSISQGS